MIRHSGLPQASVRGKERRSEKSLSFGTGIALLVQACGAGIAGSLFR